MTAPSPSDIPEARRPDGCLWSLAVAPALFVFGAIGPPWWIPDGITPLPPGKQATARQVVTTAAQLLDNPTEVVLIRHLALRDFVDEPTAACPDPPCGRVYAYSWFGLLWARVEVHGRGASAYHTLEPPRTPRPINYP